MTRSGRRRGRLDLSLRITAAFAIGALVVSVAVALSGYLFTLRFQVNQQQKLAQHQAYVNAAIVRSRLLAPRPDIPTLLDDLVTGSSTNTDIYQSGRWYSSSLLYSRDALPLALRRTTLGGTVTRTWARVNGRPQIVVGVPLPAADGAYFQLFDESDLQRTLRQLRSILYAAVAATTIAGAGLGWWASRRLTSPLRAVATAAQRISRGNLETQLPERHDRELAGLVDSFNTMVSALRTRIERDAAFAGNVSHELRSPLTTLATSVSVLEARREELEPRAKEALDLVASEVTRFERLVDDLLELSRADAVKEIAEPEAIHVGLLVLNILDATQLGDVPTTINPEALDCMVIGDKRRLHQVFRNLIENAQLHAHGVTGIAVSATPGGVQVTVDDNGPGVPPDQREHVFDRFARGRGTSRDASRGGTGLGLALVREHVRAHGGTVTIGESPSGGARFVVELPRLRS